MRTLHLRQQEKVRKKRDQIHKLIYVVREPGRDLTRSVFNHLLVNPAH